MFNYISSSSHEYLIIIINIIARVIVWQGCLYFVFSPNEHMINKKSIIDFCIQIFLHFIIFSIIGYCFKDTVTGRHFDIQENGIQVEALISRTYKTYIMLLFCLGSYVTDVIYGFFFERPPDRPRWYHFIIIIKQQITGCIACWIFFGVVVGVTSVATMPHINEAGRIFFFGYFFPILKTFVVSAITLY